MDLFCSLFVISEKSIKSCTLLFIVHAWHQKSQQSTRKKCAPEFLILSALKLPSCGLLVFTNMNTYILTEDTNLKTFLKEKYLIALDCCNLHIY